MGSGPTRYDRIGAYYNTWRVPDARIATRLWTELEGMRTVVNVGAGTGAYEPTDHPVVAIEPSSAVMAAQRPAHLPAAILAHAEALPLVDNSVDVAMAVLTVHHWDDPQKGVQEMLRVARRRVCVIAVDPHVQAEMWLFRDYVPKRSASELEAFPSIQRLCRWLSNASVVPVPVPRDCTDGFSLSMWGRPEAVLDPGARTASSRFATMNLSVQQALVQRLTEDLQSGAWDRRHGHLRTLTEYDAGLRLIVADLDPPVRR